MSILKLPDMARCLRVSRALQRYLDGEADDLTVARLAEHLEECRRCGLQAKTYRAIKQAIHNGAHDIDELPLRRLRSFNRSLAEVAGQAEQG